MANPSSKPTLNLPFSGELFRAPEKKFNETMVLVPFFGGTKSMLRRHVDFLNKIGYDVVAFTLKNLEYTSPKFTLFSANQLLGVKHIWADQVEAILNQIPGNKILFAFSNPSASAIEAIVRRNATDVTGLVCDSGPSGHLLSSMYNYFSHYSPIKLIPLRALAALAMTLSWSPQFHSIVHGDLEKIPDGFKILSIRGWKDNIIPAHDIDKVFEPHLNVDWQRLSLPQAGHLNGLKDFAEEYETPVAEFLKGISSFV
jgi:pimeloyl-ACP methyl ester carboxylesterase